jgi:hypothetical protein
MRTILVLVFLAACSTKASETDPSPEPAPTSTTKPPANDGGKKDPHASEALRRCAAMQGPMESIAGAIARLNALAPNADGPCFIASLPRPLAVTATVGTTSAQPAGGRGAPRLFLMLPKLVVSAVPAGDGSKVLEFGEWTGTTRTIKGEIAVPVTAPLAADAAYQKVLQGTTRTTCATCHREEEAHPTIPNAFVSLAFKPEPGTFVTVTDLEELHHLCNVAEDEGPRCAMIHALFDYGEITQGEFSPVVATFLPP